MCVGVGKVGQVGDRVGGGVVSGYCSRWGDRD